MNWKNYLIDIISVSLIVLLFIGFFQLIDYQSKNVSGDLSAEQLKAKLLSANEQEGQEMVGQLRNLIISLFGGFILTVLASLLIISYSRHLIWGIKWTWKWLGLISLLMLFFLTLLKVLIIKLFTVGNDYVNMIWNTLFSLIYLIWAFVVFKEFSHKKEVFSSISHSFKKIKSKLNLYAKEFGFALLILTLLNLLLMPLQRQFLNNNYLLILNAAVLLLYVAFMRERVLKL